MAELAQFHDDRFLAALCLALQALETSSLRGVDADEFSIFRCLANREAWSFPDNINQEEKWK